MADTVLYMAARCRRDGRDFVIRLECARGQWVAANGSPTAPWGESGADTVDTPGGIAPGPDYSCPYCSANNFVCCGRCGRMTCWSGTSSFVCRYCGNSGNVSGGITSVSTFVG